MEVEKRKNKRVLRDKEEQQQQQECERVKKLNNSKGEEQQHGVPTEEEVEEFFAILRRMKVAVKYFDDKGRGGREWREALETAEVTVDHGVTGAGEEDDDVKARKTGGEEIINEGFDLNAVAPEAADGGGALS